MRRELSVVLVVVLALVGCTPDEPEPEPEPDPEPTEEPSQPSGLRVGVVLPAADRAAADEVDLDRLALEDLADDHEGVAEVRAVVPDSEAFVADVADLLADDGYGLVCVLGPTAQAVVLDLAERRAGADYCALPGDPDLEVDENVLLMDLEVEELGHVVGVALGALVGDGAAEVLLGVERVGRDRFRQGLRAGFDGGGLRQVTGDLDELGEELDESDDDVAALALDLGANGGDLVAEATQAAPTLAPAPLLEEDDAALRWRVRWDRMLDRILTWQLDTELDRPLTFGLEQEAFELSTGGRSTSTMRAEVDTAAGELARDEREALDPDADEDEGADDG